MNNTINQARNAYFLGNYQKVLDVWQSSDLEDEYFDFIVARALMASRELKPQVQPSFTKKPSQQLLQVTDIVTKFLAPVLRPTRPNSSSDEDAKMIEEALKKIKESFDEKTQYYRILKIICCYLSINACEVNYVIQQDIDEKRDFATQEILFLQILCYLRGNNLEYANKLLNTIRAIDDEDILVQIAQIYYHVKIYESCISKTYNNQPAEVIQCINQAKDRYGESAKLINIMVTALINSNKFEEAFDLASKLQQALLEKEQFSDRQEMETCFSNLIVLSEICNQPNIRDESMLALQTLNPSSLFLKQIKSKYQLLDIALLSNK